MIDYIGFWGMVALLLCLPLLKTKWFIDIFLLPAYAYAVIAAFSPVYFKYPTPKLQVVIQGHQHMFIALCFVFALLMKADISTIRIKKWLGWFGVILLCSTLPFLFINAVNIGADKALIGSPFIPNSAMNAGLLVALLPFMFCLGFNFELPCLVGVLLVLFRTESSTAFLGLFALFAAFIWRGYRIMRMSLILVPAGFLVLGHFFIDRFYDDGGRFGAYGFFFQDFAVKDWLIGRGPSSFQEWSALLQYAYDYKLHHGYSLWMHSDPLQLVWEFGLIFLVQVSVTTWNLLQKADDPTFLSLVSMLAMSLLYYPSHTPVPLTILFLLIKIVVNDSSGREVHQN